MVFVVAEIGVNWDGNLDLAKTMMESAKLAGCNAVKFQAYKNEMVKDHPQHERLYRSSITDENVHQINDLAKSVGIEWFCTPMYVDAVEFLEPFVRRFKIREVDGRPLLENKSSDIFERILETKKEIIISSQTSPKNTKYYGKDNIKWLYTVPKYPCTINDIDFSHITDFDGYSNHLPHMIAPLVATILGASIIEIHYTENKSKDYIDNPVSYDYEDLRQLISLINMSQTLLRKK
jgi:N,N'-diacetyllegionaminate synthase